MSKEFDTYLQYSSLKLHFSSEKYDALKYNFKTNASLKSFLKRNDRYYFTKAYRKYGDKTLDFFVSNFVMDNIYIRDMLSDEGEKNYLRYKKYKESYFYTFNKNLHTLFSQTCIYNYTFNDIFISIDGEYPFIIKMWMQDEISLETVVILDKIFNFINKEDNTIADPIMWPAIKLKIKKLSPFIHYDKSKCIKALKDIFI